MADYTKGIRIKTLNSRYGEFIAVGLNIEEFKNNPINERGYVNFRLYKSKAGEWYATNENQTVSYSESNSMSSNNTVNNKEDSSIVNNYILDDTEVPF